MVHHYVPTIHPFHQHFVNFPAPRHCHACSKSGHIAAFGCSCPPPSLARSCRIWTRPSVPAIPAPGAVWPTTGPKGHPSSWLVHPLSAHHHLPSPSGTPCMHTHTHSESSHISAF